MPHLTIEYTAAAKALAPDDWTPLFKKFHEIMKEHTGIPVFKGKSRAYLMDKYLLGDDPEAGFVHLTVNPVDMFVPHEKNRAAGDALKAALIEFFPGAAEKKIEFSVEMRIIPRDYYWKHTTA